MPNPAVINFLLNPGVAQYNGHLKIDFAEVVNKIEINGTDFDPLFAGFEVSAEGLVFSDFVVTSRTSTKIEGKFKAKGLINRGMHAIVVVEVHNGSDSINSRVLVKY